MKITLHNVPKLSERKQQEIGQALLFTLIHHNVNVNDVSIKLED